MEEIYKQGTRDSHKQSLLINIDPGKSSDGKSFQAELLKSLDIASELGRTLGEYPSSKSDWPAAESMGFILTRAVRAGTHSNPAIQKRLSGFDGQVKSFLVGAAHQIATEMDQHRSTGVTEEKPEDYKYTPAPAKNITGMMGFLEFALARNRDLALQYIRSVQAQKPLRDDYDPLAFFRYHLMLSLKETHDPSLGEFLTAEIENSLARHPADQGAGFLHHYLRSYIRDFAKIDPEKAMDYLERSMASHSQMWKQGNNSTDHLGETVVALHSKYPERAQRVFEKFIDTVGKEVTDNQFVAYCRIAPACAMERIPHYNEHIYEDSGYLGWTNLAGNEHLDLPPQFRAKLLQDVAYRMKADPAYRESHQQNLQKTVSKIKNLAVVQAMNTDPLHSCLKALGALSDSPQ
jgi:hypothetical protein